MYKIIPKYKDIPQMIKRISDSVFIPEDENNYEYQEYLKWLEEGNTPIPADEPNEGTV